MMLFSERLEEKYRGHSSIYLHREWLVNSVEDRRVDLITITGYSKQTYQYEKYIENPIMHPDRVTGVQTRANIFNKPVVFLSARVHPGETPSSFVLNGIINFILREEDEQAKLLREKFVFKIIPCLNPDGVFRGYYRQDTLNQNLNRFYKNPDPNL